MYEKIKFSYHQAANLSMGILERDFGGCVSFLTKPARIREETLNLATTSAQLNSASVPHMLYKTCGNDRRKFRRKKTFRNSYLSPSVEMSVR